jgi:hypothetical protein
MERESRGLEQLVEERNEVARKIAQLDAKGETGEELDRLHQKHEELTSIIEEKPNEDELHKAA